MATHCPFLCVFLLFLLLWGRVCCRPPRPSHLPKELTWEAWLLLDTLSPTAARRITPKSVFIAPTFSAASLPACAEGYRTDSMGRCVKIVRVNQEAQLDFLLRRLNAMYAKPEKQPPQKTQTEGPLQVSIPIAVKDPISNEDNTDESNSVEMTAILADVINNKDDKNSSKMPQTILAVWNVSSSTSSPGHTYSNRSVPNNSSQANTTSSNSSSAFPPFSEESSYTVTDDSELQDTSSSLQSEIQKETIPNVMLTAPSTVLVQEIDPALSTSIKHHETKKDIIPEKNESNSDNFRLSNKDNSDDSITVDHNHDSSTVSCEHICGEDKSNSETEIITDVKEVSVETTTTKQMADKNITNIPKLNILDLEKENSVFSESTYWDKHKVRHTTTIPEVSMVRDHKPSNVRFPTHNHEISTYKSKNQNPYHSSTSVRFPNDNLKERQQIVFPNEERDRQPFWWLPPGWTLDETRHHPVILKFWTHAPLSRYFSSTDHPRQHHRRKPHYNPHYSSEFYKK